jgi:shikimate dehydrogenase
VLHRAALAAVGRSGSSEALRTSVAALPQRLTELETRGYRGANLTHPLKHAACSWVHRRTKRAERAGSVNTVGFDSGGTWGDTTDGPGFLDLLESLSRPVADQQAVLIGAGGAARSLAVALVDAGAHVVVLARQPERSRVAIDPIGIPVMALMADAARTSLETATVIVNATPRSSPREPIDPARLSSGTLVVDLVYGPVLSAWAASARGLGHEAYDGLGLLVHQARRSLSLWLDQDPGLEPLARAVGWPR